MNCHTSGGRSCSTWLVCQSFDMAHNCSVSLSRNDLLLRREPGLREATSSLFQSGLPRNKSPSHHTVPASSASRSVWDIGGRILR